MNTVTLRKLATYWKNADNDMPLFPQGFPVTGFGMPTKTGINGLGTEVLDLLNRLEKAEYKLKLKRLTT